MNFTDAPSSSEATFTTLLILSTTHSTVDLPATEHPLNIFVDFYYNLLKIFQFKNKLQFTDLQEESNTGYLFVGITVFCFIICIISIHLDLSLRNQIFYVFDNCTSEDYLHEYIIKIRFGIVPGASNSDLIIEFYNDKFKPLSKFNVSENYLENGLNISTKMCPGMKITSLYLFKKHALQNLEYCRVYLNTNDPNLCIHLYSIEVGDNREVQVIVFECPYF